MRLSDHQAQFTQDLANLIRMAPSIMPGYRVRLFHAKRDTEWQQMMHERHPRLYAPADKSQHPDALAADLILDKRTETGWEWQAKSEAYAPLGHQWEKMSIFNRWGGRFARGDGGHFERLQTIRDEPNLIA